MTLKIIIPIPKNRLEELYRQGELLPTDDVNSKTAKALNILKEVSGFKSLFLGHFVTIPEITSDFVEYEIANNPDNVLLDVRVPDAHAFLHSFDLWNDLVSATGDEPDEELATECSVALETLEDEHVDVQAAIDKIDLDWVVGIRKP